jgi:hypothetical protein
VKKNSFGLLELEMADLERFWRKTPLGPLGVKRFVLFPIIKYPILFIILYFEILGGLYLNYLSL